MSARRRCTMCSASRRRPASLPGRRCCRLGVEQPDQVAERGVVAAVRGGGDQHQVPVGVGGQVADQSVPLGAPGTSASGVVASAAVWASSTMTRSGAARRKSSAAALGLDEVGGHDGDRVALEDRLPVVQAAFQAADGAGQHQLGLEAELRPAARAPLLGQARRAQHGQPLRRCPGPAARRRSGRPRSVLPMPTSSAISSRTVSCRSASSSGTSW